MCNFIIRPIKCYATVDIYEDADTPLINAGDSFEVTRIEGDEVVGNVNDTAGLAIPLHVFTHAFSNNDPNEKDQKAKQAKSEKSKEAK